MCEWCEQEQQAYCQDCGSLICQDAKGDGDDVVSAPYVTSYGDLYCWRCGISNQRDIDDMEEEEAEEWGFMDFDPYDAPPVWSGEDYEGEDD